MLCICDSNNCNTNSECNCSQCDKSRGREETNDDINNIVTDRIRQTSMLSSLSVYICP